MFKIERNVKNQIKASDLGKIAVNLEIQKKFT